MTQEIDFRPVIQKLRAGVCRKTSAGGSVVVDIEETEHLMRSTADLLAVVVQLQSAPPVSERERELEALVVELLGHSVSRFGNPTDETHGIGLIHARARALTAQPAGEGK